MSTSAFAAWVLLVVLLITVLVLVFDDNDPRFP